MEGGGWGKEKKGIYFFPYGPIHRLRAFLRTLLLLFYVFGDDGVWHGRRDA